MKKIILATTLCFGLSACMNPLAPITNPVSATNLYQAEIAYDAGIKTFNELKDLCVNRTLPSVCRTYVVQGQGYIRKADAARVAAERFIDNNPTIDATNVVQAFTSLVSAFQSRVSALSAIKA